MLDIGVQTKGIIKEKKIIKEKEINKSYRLIRKAGFTKVDFNLDVFLKNSDIYAGEINSFFDQSAEELISYFSKHKEAMDKYGITPSQMHAPYPVHVIGRGKQNEYMQGNVIPKSIIIAAALGVPWVIIHPFKVQYAHGKEYERQLNLSYFKMLVPILKQCHVKVCFENLYEGMGSRIVEGVCADPEDAIWYIDTLNQYAGEELFGFCLDTGHLQLVHRDPYNFIVRMGHRLKALHLHENDSVGDLHQMPYTFGMEKGDGLDWDGIMRGLKEIHYSGTLSFETFPCMNSFPKELSETVLQTIHSIGVYLAEQITGETYQLSDLSKRLQADNAFLSEDDQSKKEHNGNDPIEKNKTGHAVDRKANYYAEGIHHKLSLGIIGTGRIAARFVKEVQKNALVRDLVQVSCIHNPKLESARIFAEKNEVKQYTDDLEDMLEHIEAVYIASPHETHYDYAKYMLSANKHVLCEKPITLKESQTKELYTLAKENKCVLMEAVKTAYCPGFRELVRTAKSGVIGEIIDVEAGFTRLTPINTREYMSPKYNGSMLEFGSYVCLPAVKLLGSKLINAEFQSVRAVNGVDSYTKAYLSFDHGMATAKTGLGVKSEGQLLVSGTKGYILAKSPWWLTKEFEVRFEEASKVQQYNFTYEGSGLQYELKEFYDAITGEAQENNAVVKAGLSEEESIAITRVLEQFMQWNEPKMAKVQDQLEKKFNQKTGGKLEVWAHRGLCHAYPENTLMAFEAAAKLDGLAGIELDVQFTKDQQIVVIHDETLDRTTVGSGNVRDYTLDELKRIPIEVGEGQYTTIPTLAEVLELMAPYCKEKGVRINIELKTSVVRYKGIEEAAMQLVYEYGLEDYIVYSSFLTDSIAQIKRLSPTAKTGALAVQLKDCIRMARESGADALHPMTGGMNEQLPDDMKDKPVRAWNGGEPFYKDGRVFTEHDLTRYKLCGVTEIFTNVADRYL